MSGNHQPSYYGRAAIRLSVLVLGAALVAGLMTGWPWLRDMHDQPSVQPQRTVVDQPGESVPADGRRDRFPPPSDRAELARERVRAGELASPIEPSEASLERGRSVYETHCQSCHGTEGQGDGPVGTVFRPEPMNLTFDYVRSQPDGRLYYTITHGSLIMPAFGHAIRPEDRWHLINFVKQGLGEQ